MPIRAYEDICIQRNGFADVNGSSESARELFKRRAITHSAEYNPYAIGETDSPFGHMHDLILQDLKSGFSQSVSLASLKIQLEAPISHTSDELQHCSKVGFASKSYSEAGGLYICKYYSIDMHSRFVKFAELSWLKPKHTGKRQEYI